MAEPVTIVSGRGDLPRRLAEECARSGRPYHVVALAGFAGPWTADHPHVPARLEVPGTVVGALRAAGARSLVLAGAVERPRFDDAATDAVSRAWIARLRRAAAEGDDGLLCEVVALLREEGFEVIAASDLLDTRPAKGVLGGREPTDAERNDAARGASILDALAPLDVGQSCVVAEGRVLGIETIQGTDALLRFVADTRNLAQGAKGGVLVKRAKAGQDMRIDAPTVGVRTVEGASRAGLGGIALQAGAVQIVDRAAVIEAADRAGLVIWAEP